MPNMSQMQENHEDIAFFYEYFSIKYWSRQQGYILGGFSTSLTPKGSQWILEIPSNNSKSKATKKTQDQVHQSYTLLAIKVDTSPIF